MTKRNTAYIFLGLVIISLAFMLWWSRTSQTRGTEKLRNPNLISMRGIHWHPELEIYVKGVKQIIPENIGIGIVHEPIHTHDDLPIIHLEFGGKVENKDILLGQFFKNWGKDMRSFGDNMKMTINEVENTEFENYVMQDGDKIKLIYE